VELARFVVDAAVLEGRSCRDVFPLGRLLQKA